MNPMYKLSEWRHAVAVVNRLFYHLDNEDMALFEYPISRLVGKQEPFNHFIRIDKVFILRSKNQEEWRKRRRYIRYLRLDIVFFV